MVLREATIADIDQIVALHQKAWRAAYSGAISDEALASQEQNSRAHFTSALDGKSSATVWIAVPVNLHRSAPSPGVSPATSSSPRPATSSAASSVPNSAASPVPTPASTPAQGSSEASSERSSQSSAAPDLLGFCECEAKGPHDVRSLELAMLYVNPEATGQGIGTKLLQRAIGDAPAFTWTRPGDSQRFYERHGFATDGATGTFGGMPVVRLVR